jgi:hypothetical protein
MVLSVIYALLRVLLDLHVVRAHGSAARDVELLDLRRYLSILGRSLRPSRRYQKVRKI